MTKSEPKEKANICSEIIKLFPEEIGKFLDNLLESLKKDTQEGNFTNVHNIAILVSFAALLDGAKCTTYCVSLEGLCTTILTAANDLRNQMYSECESTYFLFSDIDDIPIISQQQQNAVENYRLAKVEIQKELMRRGKTDRILEFDKLKSDYLNNIKMKLEKLNSMNSFTCILLKELGNFGINYEKRLEFFIPLLNEEHRGIRRISGEIIGKILTLTNKAVISSEKLKEKLKSNFCDLDKLSVLVTYMQKECDANILENLYNFLTCGDVKLRKQSLVLLKNLKSLGGPPIKDEKIRNSKMSKMFRGIKDQLYEYIANK